MDEKEKKQEVPYRGDQGMGSIGGPSREKYWSELTADQKMERLRSEVKKMQNQVVRFIDMTQQLEHMFNVHSHDSEGKIQIPYNEVNLYSRQYNTGGQIQLKGGSNKDDVYF